MQNCKRSVHGYSMPCRECSAHRGPLFRKKLKMWIGFNFFHVCTQKLFAEKPQYNVPPQIQSVTALT